MHNILRECFELTRPANALAAGFASLVAVFIASANVQATATHLFVFLSVFLVTAGGNIINDYFDVKVDRVNKPYRPIPSGRIERKFALRIAVSAMLLGILASSQINNYCLILAVLNSVLLIAYNKIKRDSVFGNFIISYLAGSAFLFGGFAMMSRLDVIYVLSLMAGLSTFAREITKDIEDMDGDRGEKTTIPLKYGVQTGGIIAATTLVLAIILSLHPQLTEMLGKDYTYSIFFADTIFFYCATRLLFSPVKYARDLQRLEKAAMFIAIFAFAVGVL